MACGCIAIHHCIVTWWLWVCSGWNCIAIEEAGEVVSQYTWCIVTGVGVLSYLFYS